ncbi:MAG: hypothetical protein L0Y62_05085 [Nitrospirae bacterium]|nr:hypothetical protein [Nitrospirota bacterium]
MLEFNQWFFVLLANFLILLFALNALLFKPLAKIFKEREAATKGALDEARLLTSKKDEAVAAMNADLAAARNRAKDVFEALKGEGLANQKANFAKAESEAGQMIDNAKRDLQAAAEKARAALKADIEILSDEIKGRLVKV